jgi:23S rRNA pseudouridine2605 synthase
MADAGVASRRDCEAMISRGDVKVNGKVVTDLPVFINLRSDTVSVNGKSIALDGGGGSSRGRGRTELRRLYIAVNKPDRTLATTKDDPYGTGEPDAVRGARRTVLDLVADKDLGRLFPVGRLGFHDTGLVLLTNDGELANRLTHARYGVPRTYVVFIRGRVGAETLAQMRRRLAASLGADAQHSVEPLRVISENAQETEIEVTLRESPKLRIDALVFEAGLKVKRLVRTAIGPVSIRGIASGNWRFLNRNELEGLMAAAGLSAGGEPKREDRTKPRTRGRPATLGKPGKPRTGQRGVEGTRMGTRSGGRGERTGGADGGKVPAAKGPRRISPVGRADVRRGTKR